MLTQRITIAWSGGSSQIGQTFELQAGAESNIDEAIPTGANRAVAFALTIAQASVLFMLADRDLTIATNNAGAPANTFELKAGVPFLWTKGSPAMRDSAGNVVADISALFVSNADPEQEARLQIRTLSDPTI